MYSILATKRWKLGYRMLGDTACTSIDLEFGKRSVEHCILDIWFLAQFLIEYGGGVR